MTCPTGDLAHDGVCAFLLKFRLSLPMDPLVFGSRASHSQDLCRFLAEVYGVGSLVGRRVAGLRRASVLEGV
jgi:hypothetical protein